MRTRRVRHAINKIGKALVADGVKEDSHLWKSWITFVNAFLKEYKHLWAPEKPKIIRPRPKIIFKADPKKLKLKEK